MYIKINVKNKVAARQDDVSIVCGNSDYVIQFTFDADWEPYETKTARFVNRHRLYRCRVLGQPSDHDTRRYLLPPLHHRRLRQPCRPHAGCVWMGGN